MLSFVTIGIGWLAEMRLVGRDEGGGYDVFGTTIARYCRDNYIEVYEGTKQLDLSDVLLAIKTKLSEGEAEKTRLRTSRGRYNRAKQGLPTSRYPFLWHYDEDDKDAYLVPERVMIFHKVCMLSMVGLLNNLLMIKKSLLLRIKMV